MIKINLFPYRAARIKENIRRQVSIYGLSILFLILAMGYYYLNFNREINILKQEKTAKQKELDSFKHITAKIKTIKKTIAEIEPKLKTIKELEKLKTGPVRLLDEIAMSTPKDKLWLTSLKESKGSLSLEGTAMDNETVADFMNSLQSKESIQSVELVRTKQKKIEKLSLNLKDFTLTCKTYAFKEKPPPETKKRKGRR
jgi:type IV pilus assembly protein PilN